MASSTPEQLAAIGKVSQLRAAEKKIKIEAEAEAKALVKAKVAEARLATNAALGDAHFRLGVPKTTLGTMGLGSSDRNALYERFAEIDSSAYVATTDSNGAVVGLTVEHHDDAITVHFEGFFNADLSSELLTGAVVFDNEGTITNHTPELTSIIEANPLWGMILWGLPAVQEAL